MNAFTAISATLNSHQSIAGVTRLVGRAWKPSAPIFAVLSFIDVPFTAVRIALAALNTLA